MEVAWDALVAEYPDCGIRHFRNTDATTGASSTTYGAYCNTPQGQVIVEKATAAESVTILSAAVLGTEGDEAMMNLVRRSETAQREADAKREYDRAQYQNAGA